MEKLQPYHNLERIRGNQFAIRVRKTTDPVFKEDCKNYTLAKLSPNAFKLWCWLYWHKNYDEFGLSCKQVCSELDICSSTYWKAIKELKEKGFLVPAQLYPDFTGWVFIDEGPLREIRNVAYKEELNPKGFVIV